MRLRFPGLPVQGTRAEDGAGSRAAKAAALTQSRDNLQTELSTLKLQVI
jgi:hypothetical protein